MKKVSFRRGVTSSDVNSESHIFSIGTTDASATVLYSDEISSGEIWFLNATVHGYDTDGSNYYFSNLVCVARSDGVSESVVFSDDSGVSWSVGFILNGSLVQLTVTGDIGTTIDWHLVDLKISRY